MIELASLFQDGAVFQREQPIAIWGKCEKNSILELEFNQSKIKTSSNGDGKFECRLPAEVNYGGPYKLKILNLTHSKEQLTLNNIYVGEVYLAGGQSNMEWTFAMLNNPNEPALKSCENPQIKIFTVKKSHALAPKTTVEGTWLESNKVNLADFSAVSFYFAEAIQKRCNCVVGVINSSWGGTIAEAWVSRSGLCKNAKFRRTVETYEAEIGNIEYWKEGVTPDTINDGGLIFNVQNATPDKGNSGVEKFWHTTAYDDSKWENIALPGAWNSAGFKYNGVLWFRKEVKIPKAFVNKDLELNLGAIDKTDISYVNGVQVGATGTEFSTAFWNVPRNYKIPAELVTSERLVIAVRARSFMFDGGLIGPKEVMNISCEGEKVADLTGDWKTKTEQNYGICYQQLIASPNNIEGPSGLFNGMIAPLIPYTIRGCIWYQGESNENRAKEYFSLMKSLINDWRELWGQSHMTFNIVQLANFRNLSKIDLNDKWPLIREAQAKLLTLNDTGLVVAIDIGEAENIHPFDKKSVGNRLALWELKNTFKHDVVVSGPVYKSHQFDGKIVRVCFELFGSSLAKNGEELNGFFASYSDGKIDEIKAKVINNELLLSGFSRKKLKSIYYAWADNPEFVTLFNKEKLPAVPFRIKF